ncbi:hypothetical protein [Bremerella sp.]|uniref:hypothetical protein n=1 Tax=Bremerella sp. TaxID=2795602 RepID=UPI00391E0028
MPQDLPQPRSRWPQFSLWFLLFVIPTVAGALFGICAAFAMHQQRFHDLMAQQAVEIQELSNAELRRDRLKQLSESLQKKQQEWQSTQSVIAMVEGPGPYAIFSQVDVPGRFTHIPVVKDSIHFYAQASDEQLEELVNQLVQRYPAAEESVQLRILACLGSLPAYVNRERLEDLESKIIGFAGPIQQDSRKKIADSAQKVLEAYAFSSRPKERP